EQVVPAAGVQPRRMLTQLVEDLVHLERGEDRLDEDRRTDRSARDRQRVLRKQEHVVPEPRLEVRFELRQVEVWPGTAVVQLAGVVEEVEREVEQARRHRRA